MAPRKQPKTLRQVSEESVADMVFNACVIIEKNYGTIDEEICRIKVENLRTFLLSKVQPLFDDLYETILARHFDRETIDFETNNIRGTTLRLRDERIFFSVIICDQLRKFSLKRMSQNIYLHLLEDARFWERNIQRLNRVVVLDLRNIKMSDNIFTEISCNCKRLAELSVDSDLTCTTKQALLNILACQELQIVKINFLNWKHRNEIVDCIRKMVKNLPKLCFFDYNQMVTVLQNEVSKNSLAKIKENFISYKSLAIVLQICPKLGELDISGRFNASVENSNILTLLSESSLRLKALRLDRFSFDDTMTSFLSQKGYHLTELQLEIKSGTLSVEEIHVVGKYCANLEKFAVTERYDVISSMRPRSQSGRVRLDEIKNCYFVHLRELKFEADSKWDERILPRILCDANGLESLVVTNIFPNSKDLPDIFTKASLPKLENLAIVVERYGRDMCSTKISKKCILSLVDHFSNLKRLSLNCRSDEDVLIYVEELKEVIKYQNLDLQVTVNDVKYLRHGCTLPLPVQGYILYDE